MKHRIDYPGHPRSIIAMLSAFALGLTSCTTAGDPATRTRWQVDSLAARCIGTMLLSGLAGGIIGAAAGGSRRDVAVGAGIGFAAGGVVCAIMTVLDAQDRARIRQAQLQAAMTNQPVTTSYLGSNGQMRMISVVPRPIPVIGDGARQPTPSAPAVTTPPPTQGSAQTTDSTGGDEVLETVGRDSAAPHSDGDQTVPPSAAEIAAASGQRICRDVSAGVVVAGTGHTTIPQQACRDENGDWHPVTATASR